MVKFKFYVKTPRGGHYNTHYARSKKKAESMIKQWNAEFNGTGYSVTLMSVEQASIRELPEYYTCW